MAGIINRFLRKRLRIDRGWILSRILNLICTKDGVNKEVYIEELDCRQSKTVSLDVRLICKALTVKLNVKGLDLMDCSLHDEIADDLANMVSHNSTVEKLNLAYNDITEEGAKILAGGLCRNSTLKELNLSYNPLRDVGAKAIITALTPDTSFTDMADGRRWSASGT